MLKEITDRITSLIESGENCVVFVCGLGGSGKTSFCQELSKVIGDSCVSFHTDWYITYPTEVRKLRIKEALESEDPDRIEKEENPKNWYDWDKLKNDLNKLRTAGELTIQNAWNQSTGLKDLTVELKILNRHKGIILCDGIYLFHPAIKDAADLIISLHVSKDEITRRTNSRDSHRSSPEYLAYKASLMKKYDLPYYLEYENNADIIINNDDVTKQKIIKG